MAQAPFVIQPQLTAISLAYRNQRLIADAVLPRIPVASTSFKWSQYKKEDAFTIPDTRVGRKGDVNEIDWSASEQAASTLDFGLEDAIPQSDLLNAQAAMKTQGVMPINPTQRSTELLSDLIALDREVRVANLVFNTSSYASGNKSTLSGTGQWSDYTNSNPISAIMAAMDTMLMRPNKMVIGQSVATALRQHPKVVNAIMGNFTSAGIVPLQALADMLELDEILVGQGFVNTAKKGQSASLSRVWGKHAVMYYEAPVIASVESTLTFGFTAEFGNRVAGTIENDPDIGLRGGTRVRVGESLKEIIAANDIGYMFQNAIA